MWASRSDPSGRSTQAATVDLIHLPGTAGAALDKISARIKADDLTDLECGITALEQSLAENDSRPSW
jgi:hypothetical protein